MIINIISEYTPIVGGGGILAEELVKRLLEKGHTVNVITWGKPSQGLNSKRHAEFSSASNLIPHQVRDDQGLTVYRMGKPSKISPFQKLKFGYLAGKKAKDLKGVVHGHIFFFPLDKKRTVYTFHTTQLGELRALRKIKDKSPAIYTSIMFKKFYLLWEKYIINNSAKLIAISQTIKNELLELGAKPNQIEVMANMINLKSYYRVDPKAIRRLREKYDQDTKIIFTIGRLLPRKGFQDLVAAIGLLKDKKIKLLIAGEGEYRQALERLTKRLKISNRVIFLGRIPKEKVKDFYSLANVTVVPSIYEPFGLVVLEAMACGSPLVCTKICDFPDIAEKAAVYAQPQNPEDLTKKIQFVLNHPKKAKKMAQYGLKKVKDYTWEPYVEKLEKLYQNLSTINY